jgi:Sulfotransferase family
MMHEAAGPASSMLPRPNLFLVGAMKSGTTYLSDLLKLHPAVFMSTPREPSYFVNPEVLRRVWPEMWRHGFWRAERNYLDLFADACAATIIGESSTNYTKLPAIDGVVEKIQAFNSRARFIYLMRDPIERTISHYWHMVRHHDEYRTMLAAIRSERQFTDVSYYAMQLEAYLKYIDRRRLYVLTFESLISDPLAALNQLYTWLGLDPALRCASLISPENVTPDVLEKATLFGVLQRLRKSALYSSIRPCVPPKLRNLAAKVAARQMRPKEVRTSAVVKYLRPIQQRQTRELSDLLARGFEEWTTLYENNRSVS